VLIISSFLPLFFEIMNSAKHSGNKIVKRSPNLNSNNVTSENNGNKSESKTPPKDNQRITPPATVVRSSRTISHEFNHVPAPPTKQDITTTTYALDEIAKHDQLNDCWLVVRNRVYDVSTMIQEHPGSSTAILKHGGQVCDEDFDFHSPAARRFWLKHYCIGRVEGTNEASWCVVS
jgi:cytochrome b involved in lipid metabolism